MKRPVVISWAILFVLAFVWGSSFILMKKGLEVFSYVEIGALRIAVAFLVLLPFAFKDISQIPLSKWKYLLVPGLIGNTIPAFLFPLAQTNLLSSVTGVLNGLTPMFTVIVGALFFSQSITYKQLIGLIVAFAGAILLSLAKAGGALGNWNWYVLYVLMATLCYGISLNVIKHKLNGLSAVQIASTAFLMVGVPVLAFLLIGTPFLSHFEGQNTTSAWRALGYIALLGMFGTALALIIFNKLIEYTDAVFASTVTYLIPVVALLWGLADGEPLSGWHYVGMMQIILGVFIANRWK